MKGNPEMTLTLTAKTYDCEYIDVGAEDGQVVVTLIGNFPGDDPVTLEEASNIVNSPLFLDVLRMAYNHAPSGTPVREAFDRMERDGGEALLRFHNSDAKVAA